MIDGKCRCFSIFEWLQSNQIYPLFSSAKVIFFSFVMYGFNKKNYFFYFLEKKRSIFADINQSTSMKKTLIFICIIVVGFQSFSQKRYKKTYFLLTDTVFTEGSYCILPDIIFNCSGGLGIHFSSNSSLDSIVLFLKKYPTLIVEIGCHTDSRPIPITNDTLSQIWAKRIVEYFIEKGIDPKRLTAKGYGEHEPRKLEKDMMSRGFSFKKGILLNTEYINSITDRKEKEAAHDLNRRTEMKILSLDAKP